MYTDRYQLSVQNFEIAFKDDDKVIEPGEVGYVSLVNIANIGQMPTPIHTAYDLAVYDNEHIGKMTYFQLPKAIEPGIALALTPTTADFIIKEPLQPNSAAEPYRRPGLV